MAQKVSILMGKKICQQLPLFNKKEKTCGFMFLKCMLNLHSNHNKCQFSDIEHLGIQCLFILHALFHIVLVIHICAHKHCVV